MCESNYSETEGDGGHVYIKYIVISGLLSRCSKAAVCFCLVLLLVERRGWDTHVFDSGNECQINGNQTKPKEIKGQQRKLKEIEGGQRESKDIKGNQSKDTEGDQRELKEIKGTQKKSKSIEGYRKRSKGSTGHQTNERYQREPKGINANQRK